MQIKTKMRYHYMPTSMAKMENRQTVLSVDKVVEQL